MANINRVTLKPYFHTEIPINYIRSTSNLSFDLVTYLEDLLKKIDEALAHDDTNMAMMQTHQALLLIKRNKDKL
jgi:hypothetical protein